MDEKECETVISQPAEVRYEYFIKKAADYEEIGGLYHEGWATAKDDRDRILLPLFPNEQFAAAFAKNEWDACIPKKIELEDFLEKWIPGMMSDRIMPSIFPTDIDSVLVEVDELNKDLLAELDNY
jgi:hypothetical protein